MPRTFLFYPAKPELSEKDAFLATCRANPGWTWILKPSDGAKVSPPPSTTTTQPFSSATSPKSRVLLLFMPPRPPPSFLPLPLLLQGANIEIMRDPLAIIAFFGGLEQPGAVGWVVQRYIDNPLLLPLQPSVSASGRNELAIGGGRKFDIRCWVMLTHDCEIGTYMPHQCMAHPRSPA